MAEDFSLLVERLHNARLRLEELNAIERNQEELQRFRETLRVVVTHTAANQRVVCTYQGAASGTGPACTPG